MSGFYKYGGRARLRGGGRSGRHRGAGGRPAGRANQYVHLLRSLGLEKGDSVAAVLPNGVKPVEVYLAALQAGWYYVPINYRLSAPEIAYIIQDSGAKAVVSHERYAEVISAAAEQAGCPRWLGSPTGRCPASSTSRPRSPSSRPAPRGAARRRRHALHVGHHRQAQGREAQAVRLRPRRDGRAVHRVLRPVRHPPPRRPGAPLHLAELPHGRHDLRERALNSGHRVVFMDKWDPEQTLAKIQTYKVTHTHMVPPSSTGCCSCPTT